MALSNYEQELVTKLGLNPEDFEKTDRIKKLELEIAETNINTEYLMMLVEE